MWMILCCTWKLLALAIAVPVISSSTLNERPRRPKEPWYGDSLGKLSDPQGIDASGDVYVVNRTCIQVVNFTYNGATPDMFFWLDSSPNGPTASGFKVLTFEYGESPLGAYKNARVVLTLTDPEDKGITNYQSFGLWSRAYSKSYGHVVIPADLDPPKAQYLDAAFEGYRYTVGSGPILVMDRRTVKVFGFTYDGFKAPDGYFFVGKGKNPKRHSGIRVPIRGRDNPEQLRALSDKYTGDKDLILDLPEGFDIYNIDYISVFCYRFGSDFGHVRIVNLTDRIPPFVPLQKRYDQLQEKAGKPWDPVILLGNPTRTNFTFQLGPPGGKRGYEGIAAARPPSYVWYVNGYMAPEIWLLRGTTYNFIVEGGNDDSSGEFTDNPLYISDEEIGGMAKFSKDDRDQVNVFAGLDLKQKRPLPTSAGRLCLWTHRMDQVDPDAYDDFQQYKKMLKLRCNPGSSGHFSWRPDMQTPETVYYQSYASYHMGGKIMVVDDIPHDLPDFKEEPYEYEEYLQYQHEQQKKVKERAEESKNANRGSVSPVERSSSSPPLTSRRLTTVLQIALSCFVLLLSSTFYDETRFHCL